MVFKQGLLLFCQWRNREYSLQKQTCFARNSSNSIFVKSGWYDQAL